MFWLIQNNLLWTEGAYILLIIIVGMLLGFILWRPVGWLFIGVFIFCFFFFRNPDREILQDPEILVCPADGVVVDIQHDTTGNTLGGYVHKVAIFLSIFDCHVNWIPYGGIIDKVIYKEGEFVWAFQPKSSLLNERNDIVISTEHGPILVRQIAGTVARRICCWVHETDTVSTGQKYGMIRFGSRVEIFVPKNVAIEVGIGQRVYGGSTILGRWSWQ